jgi:hypothetical protein
LNCGDGNIGQTDGGHTAVERHIGATLPCHTDGVHARAYFGQDWLRKLRPDHRCDGDRANDSANLAARSSDPYHLGKGAIGIDLFE